MAVEFVEEIKGPLEKPVLTLKSDKFKTEYFIQPSNDGFVFYEIKPTKGRLPAQLAGKYTKMEAALKAFKRYEESMKPSRAVELDNFMEKRNAAKVQRDSKEHVRSGTDNGEGSADLSSERVD